MIDRLGKAINVDFSEAGESHIRLTTDAGSREYREGERFVTRAHVRHCIKDVVGGSWWFCVYQLAGGKMRVETYQGASNG
jgi:hypothetical protein